MQSKRSGNLLIVHAICSIVFIVFVFSYLFFYKADVMKLAQRSYSEGQTQYNPLIGGILITAFLYIVQIVLFYITRLRLRSYWLTFFPPLLLLAWLTDIQPTIVEGRATSFHWIITVPALLIIYILCVGIARQYQEIEHFSMKITYFIDLLWRNLLAIIVMCFLVGMTTNGNRAFHENVKKENCLSKQTIGPHSCIYFIN